MSDNLKEKVNALGERLKISKSEVGQKLSSMSFKMKEFFNGGNQIDKLVEEATSETLHEPDWAMNLELCDMINHDRVNSVELIRGIKKRLTLKSPSVQYLALVLLETVVKNCEKAFSEVAAERVLNEMVKMIDDPQTVVNNRNKCLILIEAWGENSSELRYLPVYEQTYESLKSRGIRFPGRDNESLAPMFTPPQSVWASESDRGVSQHIRHDIRDVTFSAEQAKEAFDVARNCVELLSTVLSSSPQQDALQDDLTTTLVHQCRQSQSTVQRVIETPGDNESLLFEALNINDEVQKVLTKYEDMKIPSVVLTQPKHAMELLVIESDDSTSVGKEDALARKPACSRFGDQGRQNKELMDELDEMIFGRKSGATSEDRHDAKKRASSEYDDAKKQACERRSQFF